MSKTKINAALLLSVLITQLRVVPSKSNINMKRAIEALSSSSSSEEIGVAVFNTHEPTRYSWNPHPNSVHVIPLTSPEGKHELLQLERRPQVRKMYSDTLVAGILDTTYESGNHGKSKEPSKLLERVTSSSPTLTIASTSAKPNLKASEQEINLQKSKESSTTHSTQKTTLLAPSAGSFSVNLLVIAPAISEFPSLVKSKESQSVPAESHATLLHNRLDHAQQPNNSKNGSFLTFEQVSLATASEPPTSKGQLKELKTEYDDPSEKTDDDSAQLFSSEESYDDEKINLSLPEPLPVDLSNSAETATGRPVALETDSQNFEELKNLNAAKSVGSFPPSDEFAINGTQLNLSLSIIPPSNPVDGHNSQQTHNSEESSTSLPKYKQQHPRLQLHGRSLVPFKYQATNGSSRVENIENQMKLKNERNQFDVSQKNSSEVGHLKVNKQKLNEGQGALENLEQSNQRTAKISGRRVAPSGRGLTPAGRSLPLAGKQTLQDQIKLITDSDSSIPPADKPKYEEKFTSLKHSLDSRTKQTDDGFKNGKENSQSNFSKHIPRNEPAQLSSEGGQTEHLSVDEHEKIKGQGALENLDQSNQRTAKISGRRVAPSGRGLTPAGRSVARSGKQTVQDQIKFITDSDSSIPPADKPKYADKFTSLKNSLDSRTKQTDGGFENGKENSQNNYGKHTPRDEPVQLSSEGGQTEHFTVDEHEEIEGQGAPGNPDQSGQRTAKINGRRVAPSGRGLTPAGRSVARAGKHTVGDQIKFITDLDSTVPPNDKPKYSKKYTLSKNSLDSRRKPTDDGFKNDKENSQSNYGKHTPRDESVQLSSEGGQTEHLTVDKSEEINGQGPPGNPDQSEQRTAKINGRRVVPSGRGIIPHVSPHRTTTQPLEDLDTSTPIVTVPTENPITFRKHSSISTSNAISNGGTVSSETLLAPQDHEVLKNKYFTETLHSKGNEKDSMVLAQTNQQENLTFNENEYEASTTELHPVDGAFNLTTTEPTAFGPAPVALVPTQQAFALNTSNLTLLPTSTKAPRRHSSSFGRSVKGLLQTLRSALNVPASSLLHSTEATEPTKINQTVAAAQNKSVTVHIKATDGTHAILRANFTSFLAKNSSNNEAKRKVMPNVSPESLANLSFAIQDLVQAIKKHNFHHKKHGSSHSRDPGVTKRPETVENPTNISTSQKEKVPGSPEAVLIHIRAPDGTTFDLQANSSSSLWKEFQEMVKVVKFWHENQHDMSQKTNETDAHPLLLHPEQVEPSLAGLMPVNVGVNQVGKTFVLDINSEHQATTPKAIAHNQFNATKKVNFIARPTNKQRKAKHRRRKLQSYKRLHKKFKKDPLLLPAIEFALEDAIRRYQRSKGHSSKVSESIEYYDEQLERPNSMELYDETKKPAVKLNAHDPVTSDFSQKKPKVHQKLHNKRRLKNRRNQFGVNPKHSGQTKHLKVEEQELNEGQGTLENLDQSNERTGKFSGRRVAPSGRGLTPAGRNVARAGKQTVEDQIEFIADLDPTVPPADKPKSSKKFASLKNSLDSRTTPIDDGFKNGKENSQSKYSKHTPGDEPVQLSSEGTKRAGRLRKLHASALKKGKPTGGMHDRSMFPFTSQSSTNNIDLDNENQDSENVINRGGIVNEKSFQELKPSDFLYPRTSSPLIKMDDESLVYKETFNHHKPDILPTTITKYPVLMNGLHVNIATRPTTRIPSVKPSKKFIPMPKKAQALGRAATGTPSQGQSAPQDPEKFTLHDILIKAFKSGRIKP